jgi:uncharacterized membrane protein YqjE
LFFIALSVAGLGLVVYFIVEPQFFWHKRSQRILSILGSIFGIISGVCSQYLRWRVRPICRHAGRLHLADDQRSWHRRTQR